MPLQREERWPPICHILVAGAIVVMGRAACSCLPATWLQSEDDSEDQAAQPWVRTTGDDNTATRSGT